MGKKLVLIAFSLLIIFFIATIPTSFSKSQLDKENYYYYKDFLGLIYKRKTSCSGLVCINYFVPFWGKHAMNFEVLNYKGIECMNTYAKTNKEVYKASEKQKQVINPKDFKIIDNYYATDGNKIYLMCDLIPLNGNANEYIQVGNLCIKNQTEVYCNGRLIGADSKSFVHLSRGYYKDKYAVYYLGNIIYGLDPNTFELLGWGYLRDYKNLYYLNENTHYITKIEDADLSTFVVLTEGKAKDKFNFYNKGVADEE